MIEWYKKLDKKGVLKALKDGEQICNPIEGITLQSVGVQDFIYNGKRYRDYELDQLLCQKT